VTRSTTVSPRCNCFHWLLKVRITRSFSSSIELRSPIPIIRSWLWTCPRNAAGHFVSFHPRLRELKTTFRSQTWTLGNLLIPLTAMEYFVAFGRVDIRKRRALHGTAAECGGAQRRTAAPAWHGQVPYRYAYATTPFAFFSAMYFFIARRLFCFSRLCKFLRASCFMLILLVHRDKPAGYLRRGSSARLRVSHPCQTWVMAVRSSATKRW